MLHEQMSLNFVGSAMLNIFVLVYFAGSIILGGRILLWCPGGTRSIKITYMPMVEELVKRGHEITIVTPYPGSNFENITEIPVNSGIEEIFSSFSMYVFL